MYDAFSIPDRFRVANSDYGTILFDSGVVGDDGTCPDVPAFNVPVGLGEGMSLLLSPLVPKVYQSLSIRLALAQHGNTLSTALLDVSYQKSIIKYPN